jgi:hypothetical protein
LTLVGGTYSSQDRKRLIIVNIRIGIDYNHPDLGGGFGPGYKVAGGLDLVGDGYDGGSFLPGHNLINIHEVRHKHAAAWS